MLLTETRRRLVVAALLLVGVLLVYAPALHGDFVWDDNQNVTENNTLRSAGGLVRIWTDPFANQQYYPLTHTSFWVNYQFGGDNPLGYHLANVLLHCASALLLWSILRRLAAPGAGLAAALFAFHPVNVESVAWITERKNVLCGALGLAAVLVYLVSEGVGAPSRQNRRAGPGYAASLVLFAAALLAKTAVAPLPLVLLLLLWWRRPPLRARDAVRLGPFFALALVGGLVTAWLEKSHVGATGAVWSLTLTQRVLLAGRALWFYFGKLVWPRGLVFIYPRWDLDPSRAIDYLFPAAAVAVLVALWRFAPRIGRGPLVAALAYAALLAPALGFFDLFFFRYSFVQDHYQYLASMAALAFFGAAASRVRARLPARIRPFAPAAAALALVLLGGLAAQRAAIFDGREKLFRDTLQRNPSAWMAHLLLGNQLARSGRAPEAESELREAVRLAPDVAEARQSLGSVLVLLGRPDEAAREFERALELVPDYAKPHFQLARIMEQRGRLTEAAAHYAQSLRVAPDIPEVRTAYAKVLFELGQPAESEAQLREAIVRRPDYALAHYRLGLVLLKTGRPAEARASFAEAARPDPAFAALAEKALRAQ